MSHKQVVFMNYLFLKMGGDGQFFLKIQAVIKNAMALGPFYIGVMAINPNLPPNGAFSVVGVPINFPKVRGVFLFFLEFKMEGFG
jgi:hypothetical protein